MLSFCKKTENIIFYKDVNQIPEKIWEELACSENLYLSPNYLSALAKHNTHITFYYVVLFTDYDKAIAFTTIEIIDFELQQVKNQKRSLANFFKNAMFKKKTSIKILISGNPFVSGEHGIFIAENQDKKSVIKQLADGIASFVKSDKILDSETSIFLLKDFEKASLTITDELKELNYFAVNVEPNMQFKIDENWYHFEDYLAALKTKFRVKAKKAISLSKPLKVVEINAENCRDYLPQMKSLYQKVSENASFNLTNFEIDTYMSLKEKLKEKYLIQGYFLEEKMVGFLSGMVTNNHLDAHFVGIDYELNRSYAIYQRMLYDYVKIGIEKNLDTINFGRTASEIKSAVGAVPRELTIYIRHKKTLKNKILQLFLQQIAPTAFHQKFPFKQVIYENG